jgi:redox-sensitive bicupin YhaK (pirin superfamily)
VPCKVGGAGHQAIAADAHHLAADVARILQATTAKGHVDTLGDQVGLGIAEHKVHPHPWMRGQEAGHPLHREEIEQIGRRRHPHQAARRLAARAQRLPRIRQAVDRIRAARVEHLTGAGERELAGRALQQPGAQLRLQRLHAPAHGIRRHTQAPRGLGKAAAAYHLYEQGDVIEVEHATGFLLIVDECNPIPPSYQSMQAVLFLMHRGSTPFRHHRNRHTMTTASTTTDTRAIVYRTRGRVHGPITRLVSPSDLGEHLKPFVFLDLFSTAPSGRAMNFGMHPHSGIATLTYLIDGQTSYEDTTGEQGVLPTGGVEWMRAGNGVWHTGAPITDAPVVGFQLWVALPASEENAPPQSLYLAPADVPQAGPVRVLLGRYETLQSRIPAPADMSYLAVELKDGEHWRYTPPAGHTVAWLAVHRGRLDAGEMVDAGELAVFDESGAAIAVVAQGDTAFVLGSAVKHPHELVMGNYSVHTSRAALAQGEAEIQRIGAQLQREGRLD